MSLTNAQYDTIIRSYQDRNLFHQRELEERRAHAFRSIPRLEEIEHEIASFSLRKARIMLSESQDPDFSLASKIEELADEREKLLTAHGFPADYLQRDYDCPLCKDTGYIDRQKCSCFLQKEIALLYDQSNLNRLLAQNTFDAFSLDCYSPEDIHPRYGHSAREMAALALHTAKDFTAHFDAAGGNLCFRGETGTGKTFLSHCIAGKLIESGHSVLYLSSYDLFSIMERYTFSKDPSAQAEHARVFGCDLLVIDDLGTELANSFVSSQLFCCLNERLLAEKSTIISTNLSIEEIRDRYSERVLSRLISSYKILHLFGRDVRLQKSN